MNHLAAVLALALVLAAPGSAQDQVLESPFGFKLSIPRDWKRSAADQLITFRGPWEQGPQPTLALIVLPEAGDIAPAVKQMAANLKANDEIDFLLADEFPVAGRKAQTLRYRIRSAARSIWQVAIPLEGKAAVVLTFGAADDAFEERSAGFETCARSLALVPVRTASAGRQLYRHPLGISFEVPEGWTVEALANKVYFAPPGHASDRYPMVLAVTAPAPTDLDTLREIEDYITRDLDEADLFPDISSESYLGDVEARVVSWTVRERREVVRQTGLIWMGALVVLTATSPTAELGEYEPIFERAEETWRFD